MKNASDPGPVPGARGPVQRQERALAPDLARGAMLLFIAVANAAGVVTGGQPGVQRAPAGSEHALNLLLLTFVHARAYPVFAVMFGYGLVQLAVRQYAAGSAPSVVRGILVRRNAWLIAFGVVHATLLYSGDFLGAYGIVGLVASMLLLPRGDRVHQVVVWLWAASLLHLCVLGAFVLGHVSVGATYAPSVPFTEVGSLAASDFATAMARRLAEWPRHTATVLPFVAIVWLGMWGARRRLLEEPARHVRLLRWIAVAGVGIAVAGGTPAGLASAGLLQVEPAAVASMRLLYEAAGMFAGPGYVALFGLVAAARSRPAASHTVNAAVTALAALGQRSLSGYLSQSVAWLLLLSPYTLALAHRFGSPLAAAVVIGVLVWAATLVAACALARRGRPGPAESLLRRLTYGSRGRVKREASAVPARTGAGQPRGHPQGP